MNKLNMNDPRLTAYALGELNEAETKEIERLLASIPDAEKFVREVRDMSGLLSAKMKSEPLPAFSQLERERLKAKFSEKKIPVLRSFARSAWLPVAAVATLALCFVVPQWQTFKNQEPTIADMVPAEPRKAIIEIKDVEPDLKDLVESNDAFEMGAPQGAPEAKREQTPPPPAPPAGGAVGLSVSGGVGTKGSGGVVANKGAGGGGTLGSGSLTGMQNTFMPRSPRPDVAASEPGHSAEGYDPITDNKFLAVKEHPLSTFSIDVDTASYANIRRFLNQGQLPPKDAVRIEEMVNYFKYDYPQPKSAHPFSVHVESAQAPWTKKNRIVRIALKGRELVNKKRPPTNIVFLIDVSGSMNEPNRLPLLKQSFKTMVENLDENDRVAIVVYAGTSGLVLPSTSSGKRDEIIGALDRLEAGGSTNGGEGIELAYKIAQENFIKGGANRVILATDGDFNVGISDQGALVRLIEEKAKGGVFLTVLGYGMGNLKDSTLEKLANKGNGNYAYIDSLSEGRRVLVEQMGENLVTIAKDVKIQVEFNPSVIAGYRLVGYENRLLAKEDFNDDAKDAGEIGAGHTVTALYEVIPAGDSVPGSVDPLRYQKATRDEPATGSGEMMTVKLRYKKPDGQKSQLIEVPVPNEQKSFDAATRDFKFATSVAAFGMILRDSPHKGEADYSFVLRTVESNLRLKGEVDPARKELLDLVRKAQSLSK